MHSSSDHLNDVFVFSNDCIACLKMNIAVVVTLHSIALGPGIREQYCPAFDQSLPYVCSDFVHKWLLKYMAL